MNLSLWHKVALGLAALAAAVVGYRTIRKPSRTMPDVPLLPPVDDDGCSRAFFPSPNRGDATGKDAKRPMPPIWIVIHDTEGGSSAKNIASYFSNPVAKVSAHLVVDDQGDCYRCVEDDGIAWHAGLANTKSLGLEMVAPVGAYKRTREQWLDTGKLLDATADHVADWCRRYGIPAKFVDGEGLKRGDRGVTTHAEVTKGLGGSHVDPGKGFPVDDLLERVARRLPIV